MEAVVDSSVWVAALLGNEPRSVEARRFLMELNRGVHTCHLPRLVLIETCGAIVRRARIDPVARVVRARASFQAWERAGFLLWCDLNRDRAEASVNVATQYRLKGGDAIVAALAFELNVPIRAFDQDFLRLPPALVLL